MSWQKRLQTFARALFVVGLIIGNLFLLVTIFLWYLAETGRLDITGLEPVNVLVGAIIGYMTAFLGWLTKRMSKSDAPKDKSQEWRNRKQLVQNVRAAWIHGVRDQSLHQSVWIELGLKYEPEQVKRPWHMAWQSSDNQESLSEDTSILSIFQDKAANALLILGEPGSGKTVTLLDLASQLLDEAEKKKNRDAPIPVVLNLSSWALKRQPLQDWLLADLKTTYYVPEETGLAWLESDALLLFLDGLDEVVEPHRQACVKAINAYRQEHGLTGIAVCCRRKEYESLDEKLGLLGATVIQPLTAAQADNYLKRMGKELKAVRKFLKEVEPDDILHEWVKSPLFLYVTAMAYRSLSLKQLREIHTGNLTQLYDAYVEQMLEKHRPYEKRKYTPQQTRRWLAYLAGRLVERDLTVYYIEHMQPDWLGENWTIYFIEYLQLDWRRKSKDRQESEAASVRWLKRLLGHNKIEIRDMRWSWSAAIAAFKGRREDALFFGLSFGLIIGLLVGLVIWWNFGISSGLVSALVVGIGVALIVGLTSWLFDALLSSLFSGLLSGDIRNHEKPNQGVWRSLVNGLFTSLVVGSILWLVSIMNIGLVVFLLSCLAGMLVIGRARNHRQSEQSVWLSLANKLANEVFGISYDPLFISHDKDHELLSQGNTRSVKKIIWHINKIRDRLGTLTEMLFAVFSIMFLAMLVIWPVGKTGIIFLIMLAFGLLIGLDAFIKHFVLRCLLTHYNYFPWKLIPFFEYAKERLLLRRVGGGYIFIHRTFMEYFAAQDEGRGG